MLLVLLLRQCPGHTLRQGVEDISSELIVELVSLDKRCELSGRQTEVWLLKSTWHVPLRCHYVFSAPQTTNWKQFFNSSTLSRLSCLLFSLLPVMLWVNYPCSNCNLTTVSSASSYRPPPPNLLPLSISHLWLTTSLSLCVCCGSMVTGGLCVREHDQLMRTEPRVTHFPGTDGVLTGCTTNRTPAAVSGV